MTSTQSPSSGLVWQNTRTGLLFLTGVLLVCTLGLVISKNTGFGKSHRSVRVFVTDTKGLSVGNPVTISGKKVGTVAALSFGSRNDTAGIVVQLDIQGEPFAMISSDAHATIKGLGMLGDKFVDVSLGRSRERLADGGFIPIMAEPGMDDITSNAVATTAMLNELLAETVEVTRKINRGEGALGSLVNSTRLTDELTGTLTNVRALTASMASRDGIVHTLFSDRASAEQLRQTIAVMGESAEHLRGAVVGGNGTLGKLVNDDALYGNLVSVSSRADSLVAALSDRTKVLDGFAIESELYTTMRRSIASLDSLFIDMKKRPSRYVRFSVFQ